jgi:serine/threonine protein kinase
MTRSELTPDELKALLRVLRTLFNQTKKLDLALKVRDQTAGLSYYTGETAINLAYTDVIQTMTARGQLSRLRDIVAENAFDNKEAVSVFDDVLDAGDKPAPGPVQHDRRATDRQPPDAMPVIRGYELPSRTLAGRRADVRSVSYSLLYCRVASQAQQPVALPVVVETLKGIISSRTTVREFEDRADGFLVRIAAPITAVDVALLIQASASALSAAAKPPVISVALAQAELGDQEPLHDTDRRLRFVRAIAEMGEHLQVLITRNVYESLAGVQLAAPSGTPVRIEHFDDYALTQGDIADIYEITDPTVRAPHAPAGGTAALPAQRQLAVAGFTDLKRLTRSSSSVVYSATDKDGHHVAIKVLTEDIGANKTLNEAFLEPVRALMDSADEGIVHIRDWQDSGLPYFVMDWIDGEDLDRSIAGEHDFYRALRIAISIARSLHYAHMRNVLHGDLKPSNIIVRREDDQPVLLDFGQLDWAPKGAAETNRGALGTPLYVAPEFVDDEGERTSSPGALLLTPQADIYSLGILLYEIFLGEPPFALPPTPRPPASKEPAWRAFKPYLLSRQAILDAHVNADPALPRIIDREFPADLEAVILKAIEKDPEARYQTALELAEDLERIEDEERVNARPRLYDNMTETRARSSMREVQRWLREGQITLQEFGRLRRAFDPLLRYGRSAVGESRLTHLSVAMLYLFGALLVSGVGLFLINHARIGGGPDTAVRALIGLSIPVIASVVWAIMRWRGRYRSAFALGIMTVSAIPLAVMNTLYEINSEALSFSLRDGFSFFGRSVLAATPAAGDGVLDRFAHYANWQIWCGLAAALAWALVIAGQSRTMTIAVVGAVLLSAIYVVSLDFIGIRYFFEKGQLYTLGLYLLAFIPIALVLPLAVRRSSLPLDATAKVTEIAQMSRDMERRRLSLPFVYAAIIFLVVGTTIAAIDAPERVLPYLSSPPTDAQLAVIRALAFALAGGFFYIIADRVVRAWFADANAGYWVLYYLGSTYAILGLLLADAYSRSTGASDIAGWPLFGLPGSDDGRGNAVGMSLAVPLVLIVCVVLILESKRLNAKALMAFSVSSLVLVVWYVEFSFYRSGSELWVYLLIGTGAAFLALTCLITLWPAREPDIDDVAESLIKPPRR